MSVLYVKMENYPVPAPKKNHVVPLLVGIKLVNITTVNIQSSFFHKNKCPPPPTHTHIL